MGNKGPACKVSGVADVNGIGTDSSGVLYVPIGNEHSVLRFRPNCGKQLKPLSGFNTQAFDVAVDDSAGFVYVDTGIKIVVFDKGKTTPSNVLCCGSGNSFGVAVDNKHRVYETNTESRGPRGARASVYVFRRGAAGRRLFLAGLLYPVGITFDNNDNMIVTDTEEGILIFAPPYRGKPIRVIRTFGTSAYAKLSSDGSTLYASDVGKASVDVYDYSSGTYQYSITQGLGGFGYLGGLAITSSGVQH